MINAYVADIDTAIVRQLRRAAPTKAFQTLASSRRGLCYLLTSTATSVALTIRLFNVSKLLLADDLRRATAFDRSVFYKKVYEDDCGLFGGEPYVVLLGNDLLGLKSRSFQEPSSRIEGTMQPGTTSLRYIQAQ